MSLDQCFLNWFLWLSKAGGLTTGQIPLRHQATLWVGQGEMLQSCCLDHLGLVIDLAGLRQADVLSQVVCLIIGGDRIYWEGAWVFSLSDLGVIDY